MRSDQNQRVKFLAMRAIGVEKPAKPQCTSFRKKVIALSHEQRKRKFTVKAQPSSRTNLDVVGDGRGAVLFHEPCALLADCFKYLLSPGSIAFVFTFVDNTTHLVVPVRVCVCVCV
jgi:hypothetical protein